MAEGYKYHNGTRWIGGAAAHEHKVKEDGGLEQHYTKIIGEALKSFIPGFLKIITEEANKKEFKNYLKKAK